MKVLKNTLELETDTWSDPGDYPNSLAAGPLPDRKEVVGVLGELVVELTPEEFANYQECPEDFLSEMDVETPDGVSWCKFKVTETKGTALTIEVDDYDVDPDFGVDDGPEYDPVDDYERRQRREENWGDE